jgi:hypothetical protein
MLVDLFFEALLAVEATYHEAWGRPPNLKERLHALLFVVGAEPYASNLGIHADDLLTIESEP